MNNKKNKKNKKQRGGSDEFFTPMTTIAIIGFICLLYGILVAANGSFNPVEWWRKWGLLDSNKYDANSSGNNVRLHHAAVVHPGDSNYSSDNVPLHYSQSPQPGDSVTPRYVSSRTQPVLNVGGGKLLKKFRRK
tara:strand:- start:842 stop:1243 length:402 start_codon:yes stop_codon:yes gene_type:complete